MSPPCQQGKRCLVSGSGNVAQYAAEKLLQLGAVVLTLSDSTGYIYEPNGFTMEQVHQVSLTERGWYTCLICACSHTLTMMKILLPAPLSVLMS